MLQLLKDIFKFRVNLPRRHKDAKILF